jgi:hypothetical protein
MACPHAFDSDPRWAGCFEVLRPGDTEGISSGRAFACRSARRGCHATTSQPGRKMRGDSRRLITPRRPRQFDRSSSGPFVAEPVAAAPVAARLAEHLLLKRAARLTRSSCGWCSIHPIAPAVGD